MSVTTTNTSNTFTGDGVTAGPFPYTFASQLASDVQVYLGGVLQTSGYNVVLNTNPDGTTGVGGNVFFSKAPTAGLAGIIQRATPQTQTLSLGVEQAFNEVNVTNEFDRIVMMIQETASQIGTALSVPLQLLSQGFSLMIQGIQPLFLIRVNAAGNGLEAVSAAQALAQSSPTPGGGTVVGPTTSDDGSIAIFSGASGQLLKELSIVGATNGQVVTVESGQFVLQTPPSASSNLLRSQNIMAAGRQLPTSGTWNGTYTHFGNWVQTGNIVTTSDVRIFLNGTFTQVDPYTITFGVRGNDGSFAGNASSGSGNGFGLGGGQGFKGATATICAGAGGGCGGSGAGGDNSAGTTFTFPGMSYQWQDQMSGSGGGSAGTTATTLTSATGGLPKYGLYLETTGNITFATTVNAINGNGTAGAAGVSGSTAGGGGASGSVLVIRTLGSVSGGNGTNTISMNGGIGGGAGSPTTVGGGGGGGGIIDIAAAGTIAAVGFQVNAGAGGTGTSLSGASGQPGIVSTLAATTVISEF